MQYRSGASVAEGVTTQRCACRCDSGEEKCAESGHQAVIAATMEGGQIIAQRGSLRRQDSDQAVGESTDCVSKQEEVGCRRQSREYLA